MVRTAPRGALGRWAAAACLAATTLLSACGGGGDDPPPVMTLQADVAGCTNAVVHDSGHVVYVVLDRACEASATPRRVTLAMAEETVVGATAPATLDLAEGNEAEAVTIPGLGTRRVGLFRTGTWRMFPNTDSWSGRDGAGLLFFKGELYMLGGWEYGPVTSMVWKTRDLEHWEFVTEAPWAGRHGAAWLVHGDRMWVIGGELLDDVWSSADGLNWVQEAEHAPFGERYTPNAASIDGWIVVYAGQAWGPVPWCNQRPDCYAIAPRDVWRSRDGRQWERIVETAPWEGRGLIHGSVVHDGEIYLIGGGLKVAPPNARYQETAVEYSDIWSSRDGIRWTRRLETFAFPARTHFSVVHTPKGCFVSDGSVGTQGNLSNDLFHAPNCVNFAQVPDTPPLQNRHASGLADFNGSLVIMGGPDTFAPGTAIWQYFP